MYCTKCGTEFQTNAAFCAACGTALLVERTPPGEPKRLSRPVYDKKIAGVCSGFARYLDVDVTLVRIVWLVLVFWPIPIGLVAYIIAWIVMPRDPLEIAAPTVQVVQT